MQNNVSKRRLTGIIVAIAAPLAGICYLAGLPEVGATALLAGLCLLVEVHYPMFGVPAWLLGVLLAYWLGFPRAAGGMVLLALFFRRVGLSLLTCTAMLQLVSGREPAVISEAAWAYIKNVAQSPGWLQRPLLNALLRRLQSQLRASKPQMRLDACRPYGETLLALKQADTKSLAPVIALLDDPESSVRRVASQHLWELLNKLRPVSPETLASLIAQLSNPDPRIQENVASTLIDLGTPEAARAVADAGRIGWLVTRPELCRLLPDLHDAFVAYLRANELAQDPVHDPARHWRAAQRLAALDSESESALRALLADPQIDIRQAALLALGGRCTAEDIPALVEILAVRQDRDYADFYKQVLDQLVRLRSASAAPLIAVLDRIPPGESRTHQLIYAALGEIGGQQAADALVAAIGGPDSPVVLRILCQIGDLRGLRWLTEDPRRFDSRKIVEYQDVIAIRTAVEQLLRERPAEVSDDDLALLAGLADQHPIEVTHGPYDEYPTLVDFGAARKLASAVQARRAAHA